MSLKVTLRCLFIVSLMYGLLSGLPALAQDQALNLRQVTPAILDESHFADLDAYINDALLRLGGSGAAVAIVQNGEIVYVKGFGVTELNGSFPVSGDTQFMIASLVKSMTALMIGTLIEEGILTWDTPISDVLPSFALSNPAATASVTFRDLLSMRSGLPVFDAPWVFTTMSPEQIIESLAQIPLTAQPGETYHYSNLGYSSAGFISAIAAGGEYGDNLYETYTQLMQARVFDPVGMDRTTFDFSAPIATENRAAPIGLDILAGGYGTVSFELQQSAFTTTPSGAGWSTAEDLAKYLIMQMDGGVTSDGTRIISDALLEEMWLPHISISDGVSFGLGWEVSDYHGLQAVSYSGGLSGYTPRVQFLPEVNLGVVVLTNRGLSMLGPAVGDYVYELAFGLDHTTDALATELNNQYTGALAQMMSMLQTETDSEMVVPYLGQYEQGVSVRWNEAGDLVLTTTNGDFPLDAVSGQTGFFFIRNVGLLAAQFAENEAGIMTLTFVSTLGEPQQPFIVTRID
jgi:CubicO group peptidase (beta-lactamase class C family)